MISLLTGLTIFVNIAGLAITLGLGLYLVTRSVRSQLAWLAALTLFSLSGFYLHNTLLIYLPGSGILPWLRVAPLLALTLGFHLLLLLPPEKELHGRDFFMPPLLMPGLGNRASTLNRLGVPLAYGLTILLPALGVFPLGLPPPSAPRPIIYLSDRTAPPLYLLTLGFILLFVALSFLHMWQKRKQEPLLTRRRAYRPLFLAVILTGLSGIYLFLGVQLQLNIITIPADIGLGAAAAILGYVVARHYAEMVGVTIERDLLYISLGIGSLTILYVVFAKILHLGGHLFSTLTLIIIVIVAVSSLMLYDALRHSLDRLFYREHFRQLRSNLRALSRETGMHYGLSERLQAVLSALCTTLHVEGGLIALRDEESFVCQASEWASLRGEVYAFEALAATEITPLPLPGTSGPQYMALLVPIRANGEQVAALALGGKEREAPFSEDDLFLLDDLADQLGAMIQATRLQEENALLLSQMVSDYRQQEHALQRQADSLVAVSLEGSQPATGEASNEEFVAAVEDALRRLYDYSYLGEHALAQLLVVQRRLDGKVPGSVTHIDSGKALSQVLVQAMQKLRPEGPEPKPHVVPTREWHQFLILHLAYVSGEPNRDIMSRLYIGEGTFNRTRRRALRGLAKAVQEMDRAMRV